MYLPIAQPISQLPVRLFVAIGELPYQKSLDPRLFHDQLTEPARSHLGFFRVILRTLAANTNAGALIQTANRRIGDGAAHVIEVDVNAVGREFAQFRVVIGNCPVIESGIEPHFAGEIFHLLIASGDADRAASLYLGDLSPNDPTAPAAPDTTTDSPGCGRQISSSPK